MIKKSLTILAYLHLLLFSSCMGNPSCDCEQFKNGNFTYKSAGPKYIIVRKDSIQTEKDPETGHHSKLSIKWVDKCRYEGLVLETTFPFSDSIIKVSKTIPLQIEIIETGADFYVYKAQRANSRVIIDTLWRDSNTN